MIVRIQTYGLYVAKDVPCSPPACWYFTLGLAVGKATARWQRPLVRVVLLSLPGYFGVPDLEWVVPTGLLLIWLPAIRVPAHLAVAADSSFYISAALADLSAIRRPPSVRV